MWTRSRTDRAADGPFGALLWLFFSRFFDKESLSPQGEPSANVVQTLGILASPGVFVLLLLFFNPNPVTPQDIVVLRCLFLTFSMAVIGFAVVFEWDAIFPDRRDFQVLFPLPLPMWRLFLAKTAAFLLFLGMFLLAVNGAVALLWPVLFGGNFLKVIASHLVAAVASGLFIAFVAASVQGVLLIVAPARYFRSVVTCVQTMLMAVMVMMLLLSPFIAGGAGLIDKNVSIARWMPAYLFLGLHERMLPAVHSPALMDFGSIALHALGWAAGMFALTHIPLFLRHTRKLADPPPVHASGPGGLHRGLNSVLDRWLLREPMQEAVFHYIGQTIARSMKHRMFLAVYAGFGAALVIITVAPFAVIRHGAPTISITDDTARAAMMGVPLMLSFVMISGLRAAFSFPAELSANWSFQMSGANQTGPCMAAMRKWILVCAVVPLFLLMIPFSLAFFPWQTALFQFVYGVMLSAFLAELFFPDFVRIPFTCGYFPSRNNLVWLIAMYVTGLILYGSRMADLEIRLLARPLEATLFFALAAPCCAWLWKWRERFNSEERFEYLGDDDPMVRSLGLE